MANIFGELLRTAREAVRKSMGQLARHLEVSTPYISDVERGHRAPLTDARIMKAALFLETDPKPLLRAAAVSRGAFELSTEGMSDRELEVGGALVSGWPALQEDDLAAIHRIVLNRTTKLS